ncbi:MAG: hypothetical protein A2X23_05910 [Chloroflexi bacterium GWC2_73_18]|nr:MAG: hypothetical protein A2X23_05910 [Chloroflexi bacterium GWC2_73_18]
MVILAPRVSAGFGAPRQHRGPPWRRAAAASATPFRNTAYGELTARVTSSLPTPWRYQGRLLVSTSGDANLYEAGARS